MNVEGDLVRRSARHAALGDPLRLRIVDALVHGDVAPGELTGHLGIGTNLLAHHLRVLEAAGLVERARSEGDRRRTYVTLRADALDGLTPGAEYAAPRVVFVCTQNSARSKMAAALWHERSTVPVASAGTHPVDRIHPRTLAAARRRSHPIDTATASVADVLRPDDLVVAVCDQAHEELGALRRLHWSVPDPVPIDTDEAFDDVLDQLDQRVARLAATVTRS
jgi:protein-tyrosine-phosphatase